MVRLSVRTSVCVLVTIVNATKTADAIKMSFGVMSGVGQKNRVYGVLDRCPGVPVEGPFGLSCMLNSTAIHYANQLHLYPAVQKWENVYVRTIHERKPPGFCSIQVGYSSLRARNWHL